MKSREDLFIKNYNNWQFAQFSLPERSAVRNIYMQVTDQYIQLSLFGNN